MDKWATVNLLGSVLRYKRTLISGCGIAGNLAVMWGFIEERKPKDTENKARC